jgi:hypothetical protein
MAKVSTMTRLLGQQWIPHACKKGLSEKNNEKQESNFSASEN